MNPEKINRYEIVALLGEGSIGKVYKAFDPFIKRNVAVKLLKTDFIFGEDHEEFSKRFYKEAQIAGTLNHPNIAVVYDAGECDNVPYICMEYIKGMPLNQWVQSTNRPILIQKFVSIIKQISDALDYAHAQGVIHRDIKPANVLITDDSQVKILDFGIALFANIRTTKEGKILGTPYYMAPEQVLGQKIDHRVDIFALGVIAFEAITGTIPFKAETITGIITRIAYDQPDKAKNIESLGFVPSAWENVFSKVLAKDPNNRYRTASAFAKDFESIFPVMQYAAVEASPEIPLELEKTAKMNIESVSSHMVIGEQDSEIEPTIHEEEGTVKPTVIYSPTQKMDLTADESKTIHDEYIELEEQDTVIVEESPPETEEIKSPEIKKAPSPRKSKTILWVIPLLIIIIALAAVGIYLSKFRYTKSKQELLFTNDISDIQKPSLLHDKGTQFNNALTVSITSIPDGAEVLEGETHLGATPIQIENSSPQTRKFTLKMKGYDDLDIEIPPSHASYSLSIALPIKPPDITSITEIKIISDPPDSNVYWRGKLLGKTPITINKLQPGEYIIALEKEGYQKWESKATVKPGNKNQLIAKLEKIVIKPPPPKPEPAKPTGPQIAIPPIPTHKDSPGLPSKARIGGDVKLTIIVSEKGEVQEVITESSPDIRLTEAAIKSARKWKFRPAVDKNGQKVKAPYTVIFRFEIK